MMKFLVVVGHIGIQLFVLLAPKRIFNFSNGEKLKIFFCNLILLTRGAGPVRFERSNRVSNFGRKRLERPGSIKMRSKKWLERQPGS